MVVGVPGGVAEEAGGHQLGAELLVDYQGGAGGGAEAEEGQGLQRQPVAGVGGPAQQAVDSQGDRAGEDDPGRLQAIFEQPCDGDDDDGGEEQGPGRGRSPQGGRSQVDRGGGGEDRVRSTPLARSKATRAAKLSPARVGQRRRTSECGWEVVCGVVSMSVTIFLSRLISICQRGLSGLSSVADLALVAVGGTANVLVAVWAW